MSWNQQILSRLEASKRTVVKEMVDALLKIKGVEIIVLGGSYARGMNKEGSDIDLGIYYAENCPLDIIALTELANSFSQSQDYEIVNLYEWGSWINGGAWIHTKSGKIDWFYRNIDQVKKVILEATQGKFTWDYIQKPPYGFFSTMYLADIQNHEMIYDSKGIYAQLREAVQIYPEALRQVIIQKHLVSINGCFLVATQFVKKNCVYGTVGCITRIAAELTQLLFAFNRVYFATDKGALETIESFSLKPKGYVQRMQSILANPGKGRKLYNSLNKIKELSQEVIELDRV